MKTDVEKYIRSIPDFPEKGIIFRDITSVLQDADGLQLAINEMQAMINADEVDVIAGTESRGFIFGAPIAYNLHKPFVLTIWNMVQRRLRSIRMRLNRDREW